MSVAFGADGNSLNRSIITASAMMATTVVLLDQTIATIALPHMQGGLSATQDRIAWVMTTYFMAQAIGMAATGWVAGRFGRKKVYLAALAGFSICAVLSGNATSLPEILVYRAMQGMFSAPVVPISQALMLDAYPRERHGQAIAIWGAGVVFAPVMGPVIGGWLTDAYGWEWVFYVGLPFTLVALFCGAVSIRETPLDKERLFDWRGFSALALALASLQLMLDRGEFNGWFDSQEIVIEAGLVILGLYYFVVHSATTGNPFISPAIFRDRNMVLGLGLMFLLGVFVLSMNVLLPLYMQNLRGFPVMTAGFLMAPRGLGTFFSLMLAGQLVRWFDSRLIIAVGFASVAFSAWQFSTFTPDVDQAEFVITTLFNGFGIGLIWVPLTTIAFTTLEPKYRTEASTLTSLFRNYGAGIGVSAVMSVLSRSRAVAHAELTESLTPYAKNLHPPILPHYWDLSTAAGRAAMNMEIGRQALAIGFINDFVLICVGGLVSIPLILLLRTGRPRAEPLVAK